MELFPLGLILLYLVPFMVAALRNHDMLTAILVMNMLFGWTVIGWFVVLFIAAQAPSVNDPAAGRK